MNQIKITESDLHSHLKARMLQRGIRIEEIETVLNQEWEATDAKLGTLGKVFIFEYNEMWEGKSFEEKEVSVYYKFTNDTMVLLAAKARYGRSSIKGGGENEVRI